MRVEDVAPLYEFRAEAAGARGACCIFGEPVFYLHGDQALIPGHIYSIDGVREFQKISRCCEFHFDAMFAVADIEDDVD